MLTLLRSFLKALLEPARDPLRDSFGLSLERVAALRARLLDQIMELRARTRSLGNSALEDQIQQLEAEHAKLLEVANRASAELDTHRARHDLVTARHTAALAQDRLMDLLAALDDAHARAAALSESVLGPVEGGSSAGPL